MTTNLNTNFAGVQRVEEEKEFPDGCAHVEGVERLVQPVQLWQGLD